MRRKEMLSVIYRENFLDLMQSLGNILSRLEKELEDGDCFYPDVVVDEKQDTEEE